MKRLTTHRMVGGWLFPRRACGLLTLRMKQLPRKWWHAFSPSKKGAFTPMIVSFCAVNGAFPDGLKAMLPLHASFGQPLLSRLSVPPPLSPHCSCPDPGDRPNRYQVIRS